MHRCVLLVSLLLLILVGIGCKNDEEDPVPGLTWTMSDSNPVLVPSTEATTELHGWYNRDVWFPEVLKEGSIFKMWFTATDEGGTDRIGFATSPNGEDWTVSDLPVLCESAPGSWDSGGVWCHCVIHDGSEYKMFYTGYEDPAVDDDRVGLARSPDGLVWTREIANPVISPDPTSQWYTRSVYSGTVLTSGTGYQMWFSGADALGVVRTGYATSSDCVTWDIAENPVLDVGPDTYDSVRAFLPSVLHDGNYYHMWYTGFDGYNYALCYARSTDGINWAKYGVTERIGFAGSWERGNFVNACVVLDVTTLRMWYSAVSSIDAKARIGYGTSPALQIP